MRDKYIVILKIEASSLSVSTNLSGVNSKDSTIESILYLIPASMGKFLLN